MFFALNLDAWRARQVRHREKKRLCYERNCTKPREKRVDVTLTAHLTTSMQREYLSTHVDTGVRSHLHDLYSCCTAIRVTFGLRNKEKNKVELERTLVGEELGLDDRVKVTPLENLARERVVGN